ncbi:hypothetical protein BGZ65_006563, partial [Modicella reniformis]
AKSLGYDVVGAHEFYTSARCPRPACPAFLHNQGRRSRCCYNCQMFFDRDAVGAENIARVCEGQLRNQIRPDKYKPVVTQAPAAAPETTPMSEASQSSSGKRRRSKTVDDSTPGRPRKILA